MCVWPGVQSGGRCTESAVGAHGVERRQRRVVRGQVRGGA